MFSLSNGDMKVGAGDCGGEGGVLERDLSEEHSALLLFLVYLCGCDRNPVWFGREQKSEGAELTLKAMQTFRATSFSMEVNMTG